MKVEKQPGDFILKFSLACRKENQPVVQSAAGALTTDLKPQQSIQSDGALTAKATSITDKTSSKFKQQSRTTQLYLDLGQVCCCCHHHQVGMSRSTDQNPQLHGLKGRRMWHRCNKIEVHAPRPSSLCELAPMQSMYACMCVVMQRDFGASRCSVCGMVYTKGHKEDEKLHKAYHQGAVQGFKFQVCTRVLSCAGLTMHNSSRCSSR